MKKILFVITALAVLIGFTSVLVSCGSSSSPSSPAATATPTPSAPTATPTLSVPTALPTISLSVGANGIGYAASGNLWVTAISNNSLGEYTTLGAGPSPNITTFNTTGTFNAPFSLGVDPSSQNVYVADYGNSQVEVFSSTGTYLNTFGNTQMSPSVYPFGVGVNSAGTTVYVTYGSAGLIYSIGGTASSPTYSYIGTFGTTGAGQLNNPFNVRVDNLNNVWVADFFNERVAEYNPAGTYQGAVTLTSSGKPYDMIFDGSGNLFVLDHANLEVQEFNAAGTHLYNFGSFNAPQRMTFDPTYTYLYVTDNSIHVFKVR